MSSDYPKRVGHLELNVKTSDLITLTMVCAVAAFSCAVVASWLAKRSEGYRGTVKRSPDEFPDWQPPLSVGQEDWASSASFVAAMVVASAGVCAFVLLVGVLLALTNRVRQWLVGHVPEWLLPVLVAALALTLLGAFVVKVLRDARL